MPNKQNPWYPNKGITWGNLYFFTKNKVFSLNPFDKKSILEAKQLIIKEVREVSPSYDMFIKATTSALNCSESTIKRLLYKKDK